MHCSRNSSIWPIVPLAMALLTAPARADESSPSQVFAVHGQATVVDQAHTALASPYLGVNSLTPKASGRATPGAT